MPGREYLACSGYFFEEYRKHVLSAGKVDSRRSLQLLVEPARSAKQWRGDDIVRRNYIAHRAFFWDSLPLLREGDRFSGGRRKSAEMNLKSRKADATAPVISVKNEE
jgi:hypothetical protein